jgi:dTDP-4-amino-4,6-dideoxygalactose transaminase
MIDYENLGRLNGRFEAELRAQFDAVLASGWFVLGKEVSSFESEFATYCGVDHCIGVANGLDALHLSLRALELPAGSEVIVPSNTYIATILAILQAGCQPVLAEPVLGTYNIDPGEIARRITSKTRAVMVVHLYGKTCEMDAIVNLCRENGLYLIEDCAQAHGATWRGKKAGSFGDLAAFSFYPTKNLGCLGDGGAVTSQSEALAQRIRVLRNYGSQRKYHNECIGYNSRLDEMQAAFLRVKLKYLDELNAHKQALAQIYFARLSPKCIVPTQSPECGDVFHIFNIRHERRDELRAFLLERKIGTEVHYPVAPHHQPALKGLVSGEYPISELIHRTTLSLPISLIHSEADVVSVAQAVNDFVG